MKNIGIVYALLAFFIWGIAPLYWAMVSHVDSIEIVAHRTLWSAVFSVMLLFFLRQLGQLKHIFTNLKLLGRLALAAVFVSVNWGVYIWAITHEYIVESSMGYFINPLVSVLFGVMFFGETLRKNQKLAIGIAALGVAYLVVMHGRVPYIALILAFSFGTYGAIKKSLSIPAIHSIAVEMLLVSLPALAYLMTLSAGQELAFGNDLGSDVVLILGGAFTMAPLILFSTAVKQISLTAMGMTQYLGPTLQLLLGVWVFNEPFELELKIAFGFIWSALIIYTADQILHKRRARISPAL